MADRREDEVVRRKRIGEREKVRRIRETESRRPVLRRGTSRREERDVQTYDRRNVPTAKVRYRERRAGTGSHVSCRVSCPCEYDRDVRHARSNLVSGRESISETHLPTETDDECL